MESIVDCDNFEKLTCDICSQVFSSLSSMKRHNRELHFGPKYNIDFDDGSQTSKKFECETCGKKFARKYDLRRHILSVHNEHSYHCSNCDLKFGRKDALIRHDRNVHMANDSSC